MKINNKTNKTNKPKKPKQSMLGDYILGAELAKKADFNISNISMTLKEINLIEGVDYLKFGGITLLNKHSKILPKYIKDALDRTSDNLTNLSEYLPYNYFKEMIETDKLISSLCDHVKIEKKRFVRIKNPKINNAIMDYTKVKSIVHREEIQELLKENLIEGYFNISKDKSLCWY